MNKYMSTLLAILCVCAPVWGGETGKPDTTQQAESGEKSSEKASEQPKKDTRKRVAPDESVDRGRQLVDLIKQVEQQKTDLESERDKLTTYQLKSRQRRVDRLSEKEVFHANVKLDDIDGSGNGMFVVQGMEPFQFQGEEITEVALWFWPDREKLESFNRGDEYNLQVAVVFVPSYYVRDGKLRICLVLNKSINLDKVARKSLSQKIEKQTNSEALLHWEE